MAPSRTRFVQHRWDMHALQALSKRDPDELTRVFTEIKGLPEKAVDTQIKAFGFGAPKQFHTFGFFDKTSEVHSNASKALFERAVDGDTLILLALRHYNPQCAIALTAFEAMAFLRLHPDECQDQNQSDDSKSRDKRFLKQRVEYETLFGILHNELKAFHDERIAMTERALSEIYQQFAPDRALKIPSQLEAFVYREHILLEDVRNKYIS